MKEIKIARLQDLYNNIIYKGLDDKLDYVRFHKDEPELIIAKGEDTNVWAISINDEGDFIVDDGDAIRGYDASLEIIDDIEEYLIGGKNE